jgi:hypothetical protein
VQELLDQEIYCMMYQNHREACFRKSRFAFSIERLVISY